MKITIEILSSLILICLGYVSTCVYLKKVGVGSNTVAEMYAHVCWCGTEQTLLWLPLLKA